MPSKLAPPSLIAVILVVSMTTSPAIWSLPSVPAVQASTGHTALMVESPSSDAPAISVEPETVPSQHSPIPQASTSGTQPPSPALDPFEMNLPVNESVPADRRLYPRVAADGAGRVYVTWMELRSGAWHIHVARSLDNGTTFDIDRAITVGETTSSPHEYPDVAIGVDGTVFIAYQGSKSGVPRIYVKRSVDHGLSWLPAVPADSSSAGTMQSRAALAVMPSGVVCVAWTDYRFSPVDSVVKAIFVGKSANGGVSFTPGVEVSDSRLSSRDSPDLASSPEGNLYCAWYDNRNYTGPPPGSDYDIYFSRSTDGGATWSPNLRLDDVPQSVDSYSPKVAAGSGGKVSVAWDYGSNIVCDRSLDGGVTFGMDTVVTLDREGSKRQNPTIAMGKDGQSITVAWADDRSGDFDVYLSTSSNGGSSFGAGEYAIDDDAGTSGIHDAGEAVVLDGGNGVLDPGLLDGIDSTDRVTTEGRAALRLEEPSIFQRLFYADASEDGIWQRGEDIIYSSRLPKVYAKSKLAYDDTGEPLTDLNEDDEAGFDYYYEVTAGEVMGIAEWNTGAAGLTSTAFATRAMLKVVYFTNGSYSGTEPVRIRFSGANITTSLVPADTSGAEVTAWIDLKALGATTVASLAAMDLSFSNTAGSGSVCFDQCVMYVRIDFFVPGVDVVVYSGGTVEATSASLLSSLDKYDRVLFHDADHDGSYDLLEPLVLMAAVEPSPATLGPTDEVLAKHGGGSYSADMNQFPVNAVRPGVQDQPGACQVDGVVFLVWASGMNSIIMASSLSYQPPTITHTPAASAELGSETQITAGVADDGEVLSVTLHHSGPGETVFTAVPMVEEFSGVYSAFLPGYTSIGEARYYIEAWDGTQSSTSPANGPAAPYTVQVADTTPPILSVSHPDSVRYDVPATVIAQAADLSGIQSVSLTYWNTTGGDRFVLPMAPVVGGYVVDIPPQGNITMVRFFVNASDGANNATQPSTGYLSIAFTDPNYPAVSHTPVTLADLGVGVSVLANVSDDAPLAAVTLFWRLQGAPSYQGENMTLDSGTNTSGIWQAMIPASTTPCLVEYYILVNDSANNSATHPVDFPPPHLLEFRDLSAPNVASSNPPTVQVLEPITLVVTATDNSATLDLTMWATEVGGSDFSSLAMAEDDGGAHDFDGDGMPTPGLFGCVLPSPNRTGDVAWYVIASDGVNDARHPAAGYARTNVADWTPPSIIHAAVTSWPVLEKAPVYATVNDNYALESVVLWSTAAGSNEFYSVQMSELSNGTRFAWIPAQSSLGALRYFIEASDGTNVTRWPSPGADASVVIFDDQPPMLMHDSAGVQVPFDQPIPLSLQAYDNLGVSSILLHLSFNGAVWSSEPMELSNETIGQWSVALPPVGATGELRYWFEASDGSNDASLPAGAPSSFFAIGIVDLDPPTISVSAPGVCDIETPVTIVIRAEDNLAVEWVRLHMTNGTNEEVVETTGTGAWWNATVGPFPEPTEVRWYVEASDGTSISTNPTYAPAERYVIDVRDLVPPAVAHTPPASAEVLEPYMIEAGVVDLHGVTGGEVVYLVDGEEVSTWLNLTEGDSRNGTMTATIPSPAGLGTLQYRVVVYDRTNAVFLPGPGTDAFYSLPIVDSTPPSINILATVGAKVGSNLTISAEVTDNFRVEWVELWFKAPGGECYLPMPMRLEAGRWVAVIPTLDRPGTLSFYVNASDGTHNASTLPGGLAQVSVSDEGDDKAFEWTDIAWALIALLAVILLITAVLLVARRRDSTDGDGREEAENEGPNPPDNGAPPSKP